MRADCAGPERPRQRSVPETLLEGLPGGLDRGNVGEQLGRHLLWLEREEVAVVGRARRTDQRRIRLLVVDDDRGRLRAAWYNRVQVASALKLTSFFERRQHAPLQSLPGSPDGLGTFLSSPFFGGFSHRPWSTQAVRSVASRT